MVRDADHHFLNDKQLVIGHDFVGFTLGRILILIHPGFQKLPHLATRILAGKDTHGATYWYVNKGASTLPIVDVLQSAFAKPAAGNSGNRVGRTSVNLNVDNEALVLGWLINTEEPASQHRHPNAQDLARANMAPMHRCSINQ
jgi:hypothetical protein